MNENLGFWNSILNYGKRAIGAVVREFISSDGISSESITTIGPIEITYEDGIRYGRNTSKSSVVLSCASVDNEGRAQQAEEVFFRPQESNKNLTDQLDENLAGTVSWRIFDNQGQFKSSNGLDSGGLITSLSDWSSGSISLSKRDLNMIINKKHNYFSIQALSYNYTNVTIYVVTRDGSFYNFGPFNIDKDTNMNIDFPSNMDKELPISSIIFKANSNEERYQALLKGA